MTKFKPPLCTLHKAPQLCLTVLHKYTNCYARWNGEKVKTDEIKICVIFECEWNSR